MKVFGPAAGLSAKFAVVSGRAQPAADQAVLTDYRLAVEQLEARLETVDAALVALAQTEPFRPPVGWLRCFRGIDTLTAITLVAELHDVRRFTSVRALMAYVGMVPSVSWFPSWTGQGTEPASKWRVDGDEGVSAVDGEAEG